ncbi:LysR substrate-binding domain-containing protein [Bradyrhizobium sp. Pa8]|uniref:LysR substrate-binding domain-containing protein n=1 Tax=Bradyrhizobium sp. Pa8 TaxID=3386552 RepID=UPI00403EFBD7
MVPCRFLRCRSHRSTRQKRSRNEVHRAVRAGHGLAQLPSWMVQDGIRDGKLRTVLDGMSGGTVPINILWPRTGALPAKIRVVVDSLVRCVSELSTAIA